jgi:ABC-type phosphate transport system auxiliary subunit
VQGSGHDGESEVDRRVVVFGEEMGQGQSLPQLLADVQANLGELAGRYADVVSASEQVEILDSALNDLDAALERVRAARARLLRIELRLAARYERGVARLRAAERELESDQPSP